MNSKDVDKSATLLQQENRSLRILDTIDTIKITLIIISIVIAISIFNVTQHLMTNFFYSFYKDIELKKLLWADAWTANQWFILILGILLIWAILFGTILTFVVFCILDWHLKALDINLSLKMTTIWSLLINILFWFFLHNIGIYHLKKCNL